MQQLVYFIQKYKYFLYFLLLQIIALFLIINNHNFHKSKFISSANAVTGGVYDKTSELGDYFSLKLQNDMLSEENKRLKNKLQKIAFYTDTITTITVVDSLDYKQEYSYINGKIRKNEYTSPYNYITINRGKKHGVTTEMGVVNSEGIIGIIDDVSKGYARVRSILNRNSKINARFKNNYYFGTLIWNASDYNIVQLTDIPRQANFNVGDTIVTGGKSSIFPEGIPIGTVLDLPEKKSASNSINIQLFNDMSNIGYIYVIKNFHKSEINELEKQEDE